MSCTSDGFQCLLGCTACILVGACEVHRMHGMASSVTEAQSHDKSRVEVQQEFMGVHGFTFCSNARS